MNTIALLLLSIVFLSGCTVGYVWGRSEREKPEPVSLQFQITLPELRTQPLPDWI